MGMGNKLRHGAMPQPGPQQQRFAPPVGQQIGQANPQANMAQPGAGGVPWQPGKQYLTGPNGQPVHLNLPDNPTGQFASLANWDGQGGFDPQKLKAAYDQAGIGIDYNAIQRDAEAIRAGAGRRQIGPIAPGNNFYGMSRRG